MPPWRAIVFIGGSRLAEHSCSLVEWSGVIRCMQTISCYPIRLAF